jgi:hypothetical protein
VPSADGIIPVIFGEYGPSPDTAISPNYNNVIYAVQQYENVQNGHGCLAWTWYDGGGDPMADSQNGPLDPWGQEVSTFIDTGVTNAF